MPNLFDPLTQRSITLRNRICVSPMCQYCAENGVMNDWHFVHLGQRAVGGAGLVMTEATGVEERGRISPGDTGIYDDSQMEMLSRITNFIKAHGAVPAIQLAHAGRKASTTRPWDGNRELTEAEGRWETISASTVPFSETYPTPKAMTLDDIKTVTTAFGNAAKRALDAGFQVAEIHAAHGYLIHQFLSPTSNKRTDQYGGSFDNRVRFLEEVIEEVRRHWPDNLPLWMRISSTDWAEPGVESWDIDQSVELAKRVKSLGIDLIDCSSGGQLPNAQIPVGPLYQTPFAERIKREAGIATSAVGMITEPAEAADIIESGRADVVSIARAMLRDPYWPIHAARSLDLGDEVKKLTPKQYGRAF